MAAPPREVRSASKPDIEAGGRVGYGADIGQHRLPREMATVAGRTAMCNLLMAWRRYGATI
jgi:hypothetical protein